MRYTLLEMVQRILGAMESDEVSSIFETVEAQDVAAIVKECYYEIISDYHPSETEGLFKLDASTDNTKPCLMYLPSNVSKIKWLKYDHGDGVQNYWNLRSISTDEFIFYTSNRDLNDTATDTMTVSINGKNYTFTFRNDAHPTMYTIIDDRYVIFDQYLSTEESTLTEDRSLGYGILVPTFTLADDFIPDLDPRQFSLLLQESKATAFTELKQVENPKAERKARRGRILMQQTRNDNEPGSSSQDRYVFGRRPAGYSNMKRAMRYGR